jgi:AcrR family transcriptional regulator
MESREAILLAAARMASVRGFEGVSIGALAEQLGMSKSGLFAHFGSKEELELATIEAADRIFEENVVAQVQSVPPGLPRLKAITDSFFHHVESKVFPGGCFFAAIAAEFASRPGRVRDRIMGCVAEWSALLSSCFEEARSLGQIRPDADLAQLVFEVRAMLMAGNQGYVMTDDPLVFARAKKSIEEIVARAMRPQSAPRTGGGGGFQLPSQLA